MVKPAIVCVDDQRVVLSSLGDQLARYFGMDYDIELAASAPEALEIFAHLQAEGIEIPLIICDQIMPGMQGDELLVQIHAQHPKTLKIMLTGQASAEAIGHAVNAANLYRYITKPWDETDLILTVKEALRRYAQDRQLAKQNEALRKLNGRLEQLNVSLEQKVAERTAELIATNAELEKEIEVRKQTEEQLELFFSQSLDGFFFMMLDEPVLWDDIVDQEKALDYIFAHQRITKVNDAMLEQYGASREQMLGLTPNELFAHDRDYGKKVWRRLLTAGRLHVETDERRFDGRQIWVEGDYICLYDAQGRFTGHFGIQRNISDRKRAEEAVWQTQLFLHSVIENIPDMIFVKEAKELKFVRFNKAGEELLGYPRQELIGKNDYDFFPEDEADFFVAKDREVLASGNVLEISEEPLQTRNKGVRILHTKKLAILDETGTPQYLLGISEDITERKRAQEALARRERYLAVLVEVQRQLLACRGNQPFYNEILPLLGKASGASRVYVFENHRDAAGDLLMSQRAEWCAEGIHPEIDNPALQNLSYANFFPRWANALAKGETINGIVADFPESERVILEPQSILSLLILPLIVNGEFFGIIGFDNCIESRAWDSLEVSLLNAAASAVSLYLERKQAEATLQESEQRFRQLAENVSEVFWMTSIDKNQLIYISPAYEKIWGHSCESLYSSPMNWADAIHPEDRARILAAIPKQSLGEYDEEYRIIRPDGEMRWIRDRAFPIHDETGQVYRVAGIADDISDRKQAEEQLHQTKEAAEAANRAKSEFLANMSHELRTPLNAILGFTQVMNRDPSLLPEHRDYIDIINRSGQHLLGLINDVLEMSKIEAGRIKLNESTFNFYQLLDNLEEMLRLKATSKQLALVFERSPDVPQYIICDESKLRQVLINLVDNAIKFTQTGTVTLKVKCQDNENRNPPQCQLLFEVTDTGSGIATEDLKSLFKPFVQIKNAQQFNQGTGLGLTISRKFINLMGGDITVSSTVGIGSVFKFNILAHPAQVTSLSEQPQPRQIIGLAPGQPQYRLLIVEDRWENSLLLTKLLTAVGFEVKEARNGLEGIAVWEAFDPHLILMDMQMPIMNGYEATQKIKATAKGQATVIIAVTGFAFEENRAAILSVGCDDFVSKPFQEAEIFAKLAQHLGVSYLYEDTNQREEDSQEISHSLTREDLAVMPEDWIAKLYQAASGCDEQPIFELLEEIPSEYKSLANTLAELAYNFRFEEIIKIAGEQLFPVN